MVHYRDSRTSHTVQDTVTDYDSVVNHHLRETKWQEVFLFLSEYFEKWLCLHRKQNIHAKDNVLQTLKRLLSKGVMAIDPCGSCVWLPPQRQMLVPASSSSWNCIPNSPQTVLCWWCNSAGSLQRYAPLLSSVVAKQWLFLQNWNPIPAASVVACLSSHHLKWTDIICPEGRLQITQS